MVCIIAIENAGFELALVQWLVLSLNFSDQHVHRIIARSRLIAPRVRMTCRLLLRCVASHSVLPRERFSPLALFGHGAMSDLSQLSGVKRKSNFGAVRSVNAHFRHAAAPSGG